MTKKAAIKAICYLESYRWQCLTTLLKSYMTFPKEKCVYKKLCLLLVDFHPYTNDCLYKHG